MKGKKRFTLLLDYSNSRNSRLINTTSESKRSNSTVAQSILVQPLSTRRNNEILSKILQRSRGSMDRVSDYGSEGWGFKSLRGCSFLIIYLSVKNIYSS